MEGKTLVVRNWGEPEPETGGGVAPNFDFRLGGIEATAFMHVRLVYAGSSGNTVVESDEQVLVGLPDDGHMALYEVCLSRYNCLFSYCIQHWWSKFETRIFVIYFFPCTSQSFRLCWFVKVPYMPLE